MIAAGVEIPLGQREIPISAVDTTRADDRYLKTTIGNQISVGYGTKKE